MGLRPMVYWDVTSLDSFQPWLDQVTQIPMRVIAQVREQVPETWLDSDDANQLETLLERLFGRRTKVPGSHPSLCRGPT